jgi:hypothetical protein
VEKVVTKLKKMTHKDVMGVEKFAPPKAPMHLYAVIGVANGARIKPTQFSAEQYVISGRFKAIRNDGDEFESLECYLPEPAQSVIAEAIKDKVNAETGEVTKPAPIEFAYMIGIAPSKRGALGYTWTCEPMMDEKEQNALSAIELAVKGKLPKFLPKPEAAKK